ncbi:MAG: transporter substrate-binding domain-containing protein [Gemmatimonadota bacterium]|nr:transporter substrate-binding domain-containing protein [Gemmatimonadota bacterium]
MGTLPVARPDPPPVSFRPTPTPMPLRHPTLALIASLLAPTGTSAQATPASNAFLPDTLVIATSNNFPPVNLLGNGGELTGFARDLSTAVLEAVGKTPRYVHSSSWTRVLDLLMSDSADFIDDTGYTPGRDAYLDFTDPILEMDEVIFVQRDRQDVIDLESLRGRPVACVDQHISHLYLDSLGIVECVVVPVPADGMMGLVSGEVDAFVYPREIGLYYIQQMELDSDIKLAGDPLRTLTWSMTVREGDGHLRDLLNRGIRDVRATGRYDRIRRRWFGTAVSPGRSPWRLLLLVGGPLVLGVILVGSMILLVMNLRLRKARLGLAASEARLRAIVDSSLDIVTLVSPDGIVLTENPSMQETLGYPPEEMVGTNVLHIIHPDDAETVAMGLRSLGEDPGGVASVVTRVRAQSGEWRVIEAIARNMEPVGAVEGILVNARDITSRREAELLSTRMGRILDESLNEIYLLDQTSLRVLQLSRAAAENLGHHDAEPGTLDFADFFLLDSGAPLGPTLAEMAAGHEHHMELRGRMRRKDGTTYEAEARVSTTQEGDPPVLLVVAQDVSERVSAEEKVRQMQKMEAVGSLASGVAHDFNNLLQIILSSCRLIRHEELDPRTLKRLSVIEDAGKKASGLTNQLLTFSRRTTGESRPLDLNAVVSGTRDMLHRLLRADVKLVLDLDPDPIMVMADETNLNQVILNLSVNSHHAMTSGGTLTIMTGRATSIAPEADGATAMPTAAGPGRPQEWALLRVSDTGTGMDPETLSRVFEPFFTTKPAGTGTGLGLSMVHSIVEKCGGYIDVTTERGVGTEVSIYFPVPESLDGVAPEAPVHAPSSHEPDQEPPATGRSRTVLIAEDNPLVRESVVEFLVVLGFEVIETTTPEEALAVAQDRERRVDILLTDVVMPETSGPVLARQVRAVRPDVRVVFMSGYAHDTFARENMAAEDVVLLPKPFGLHDLARVMDEVLTKGRGPANPA